jgi:mannose-1-phosphate guanylyltransferase
MRALLLAAGLGTRLRPLTDVLPKCLAPVRGRPLLEYWLDALFRAEAERVVVNVHHHAGLVEAYLAATAWRDRVVVVHEDELLGTGGTILRQAAHFPSGPFLVAHADNLSAFDCRLFMRAHALRPPGCAITMMTFATPFPDTCGIVSLDGKGIVREFHEKVRNPPGNLANAAVYVIEHEVVEFIRSLGRQFVDFSTEVIPHFLGRMFTYRNTSYHEDIGTLDRWRRAQHEFPGVLPERGQAGAWLRLLEAHPGLAQAVDALLVPEGRAG